MRVRARKGLGLPVELGLFAKKEGKALKYQYLRAEILIADILIDITLAIIEISKSIPNEFQVPSSPLNISSEQCMHIECRGDVRRARRLPRQILFAHSTLGRRRRDLTQSVSK
jgi:hypothetical protein